MTIVAMIIIITTIIAIAAVVIMIIRIIILVSPIPENATLVLSRDSLNLWGKGPS